MRLGAVIPLWTGTSRRLIETRSSELIQLGERRVGTTWGSVLRVSVSWLVFRRSRGSGANTAAGGRFWAELGVRVDNKERGSCEKTASRWAVVVVVAIPKRRARRARSGW